MLSLIVSLLLGAAVPASCGEKFEDQKLAFERAAVAPDPAPRSAALDALVASGNPMASSPLFAEYVRVTAIVDEQNAKASRARGLIERQQVLIEQWKARVDRDDQAKKAVENATKTLDEEKVELAKCEKKLTLERPWREELSAGTAKLLAAISAEKRKKIEAELLADASDNASVEVRLAAIDLAGAAGSIDSANALVRLSLSLAEACDKFEERLPKLMIDVHKMEERLAKEAGKQSDGFSKATYEQYDAVKRDASEVRTKIHETSTHARRAALAAAAGLRRGSDKDVEELAPSLIRSWKKSKGRARQALLAVLTSARVEPLRALLRAQLAAETEPLSRAEWIDALAAQGDASVAPELIQKHLLDPAWLVRSSAVKALDKLRSREAIPVLIARLASEEGRMRTDLGRALTSLTGKNFHGVVELWQRWWAENEAGFQVPPVDPGKTAAEEAKDAIGVSFFGISTESQRVLFVIDCSLSMNFSMTPKNNPTDDPGRPYDKPDEAKGEWSRLTAAKRDLEKALGGIKDGGEFDIVCYAADVWAWDDAPATMSPETRKEALAYVNALEGAAGTNIYSALEKAFDMAGVKSGNAWSKPVYDTIFFLTDGRATIGVTKDTEEILSYVRERNANAGIVLHTIGLSAAQDADLLKRLASENGGQYVAR